MHVAGGDDRLVQPLAKVEEGTVEIAQSLFVGDGAVAHHEVVVGDRLDLDVIVEAGELFQPFRIVRIGHEITHQLARFAGAADNEPFPGIVDEPLGNARTAVEIAQLGFGDQAVEIFQACRVLRQQDAVVAFAIAEIHRRLVVVDDVSLDAVDDLDPVLLTGGIRIWERLHNAVVCHSDGLMAELRRQLDQVLDVVHAVHAAHLRVQMQLHAFFRRVVDAAGERRLVDVVDDHAELVGIVVILHLAAHLDRLRFLERGFQRVGFVLVGKHLAIDRVGVVRQREHDQRTAALELAAVEAEDRACQADAFFLVLDLRNSDHRRLDKLAFEHARRRRHAACRTVALAAVALWRGAIALRFLFLAHLRPLLRRAEIIVWHRREGFILLEAGLHLHVLLTHLCQKAFTIARERLGIDAALICDPVRAANAYSAFL